MTASRVLAAFALALASTACEDGRGIFDVQGLWAADSYEYRSGDGETIDLVERDGASSRSTWRVSA